MFLPVARTSFACCVLVCACSILACSAQPIATLKPASGPDKSMLPRADLRVDVPLVMIPVHVTNQLGASIVDLKPNSFRLFEDRVEQKIAKFVSEDAPASVGLLFDLSGSMKDKMGKASDSAMEILKTANAEDEFFLVEFNDKPKLVVPFTRDIDRIQEELARARPHGQTSLLDAIHVAIAQMKNAHYLRKAL